MEQKSGFSRLYLQVPIQLIDGYNCKNRTQGDLKDREDIKLGVQAEVNICLQYDIV